MSEETITDLYNCIHKGLKELADVMQRYSSQLEAGGQLIAMQQAQIIELKKRIEALEQPQRGINVGKQV